MMTSTLLVPIVWTPFTKIVSNGPVDTFIPLVVVSFALIQLVSLVAFDLVPIRWVIIKESIAPINGFVLVRKSIQKAIVVTILRMSTIDRPFHSQEQRA
jgi:hypothetical protein